MFILAKEATSIFRQDTTGTMIRNAHIRRAHAGDALAIAKVHVDSWRAVYRELLPTSYLSKLSDSHVAESILHGLLDPHTLYFIAEAQRGKAVGYICGGPNRTGHQIYQSEIYELYISPAFQRRGLGRRLGSVLAGHLHRRHYYTLVVWVLALNPNRRFYEKIGGLFSGSKIIAFAGKRLQAAAYGWIDITLARTDQSI